MGSGICTIRALGDQKGQAGLGPAGDRVSGADMSQMVKGRKMRDPCRLPLAPLPPASLISTSCPPCLSSASQLPLRSSPRLSPPVHLSPLPHQSPLSSCVPGRPHSRTCDTASFLAFGPGFDARGVRLLQPRREWELGSRGVAFTGSPTKAAAAWEALLKQRVPGIPLLGACENTGGLACPTRASRPR